jgi:hypothetical protein
LHRSKTNCAANIVSFRRQASLTRVFAADASTRGREASAIHIFAAFSFSRRLHAPFEKADSLALSYLYRFVTCVRALEFCRNDFLCSDNPLFSASLLSPEHHAFLSFAVVSRV